MRSDIISTALAIFIFLLFLTQFNISLATETSKAQWSLICGGLFFLASAGFRSRKPMVKTLCQMISRSATLILAAIIVFSLPIQASMLSILPAHHASILNITEGNISGPRAVLSLDLVNAGISFTSWNRSHYRIVTTMDARSITKSGARDILDKCNIQVDQSGENITIYLSGPKRACQKVRADIEVRMPRQVLPSLMISVTNGTMQARNLTCGRIESWIGSGTVSARNLEAWTLDITVDSGPMDLEVAARKLELQTIQGEVRLNSTRPQSDCTIQTVGGSIEARLNYSDQIAYSIEANSIGGAIRVNLTDVAFTKQKSGYVLARTKDYKHKEFNSSVVARTTTGNITISQLGGR